MSFHRVCELLSSSEEQVNEEIKRLIKNESLFDAVDASQNTLLHHAVNVGNHKIVQFLVDLGSKVDAENNLGQTPLLVSLKKDLPSKEVIQILLKASTNVFNAPYTVGSKLWLGESPEKFMIFRIFLENATDLYRFGLLKNGTQEIIKNLLQTNIDLLTSDGNLALIHALAQNNNPGVMALVRGKNFDINVRDSIGWTPLGHAAFYAATNSLKFLIDEGAVIDAEDNEGKTPLFLACGEFAVEENIECVQILLEHGANAQIEIPDDLCPTVLDSILEFQHCESGELILAHLALQEAKNTPETITELIRSKIESNSQFKSYFKYCQTLLTTKIYGSLTLFDVLVAREIKLEGYLRNQGLALKLKALQTVDYYDEILRKGLSKAKSMLKLRKSAALVISKLIKMDYNRCPFIADDIASYLDKAVMEHLVSIQNDSSY